ncbi:hypothetical protein KVV02_004550, partial [Mortierella alpina]
QFTTQLRKIIRDFMCPFKPQAGWSVITTPRMEGGLGVIDPEIQAQASQLKQLSNMVSDSVSWGKEIVLDIIQLKTKSERELIMTDPLPDAAMTMAMPLREEKATLVREVGAQARTLSDQCIQAAAPPPKIPRGDGIAALIRETNISTDDSATIELQKADTKQLRQFFTSPTYQPPNAGSSVTPEIGTKQQWQAFWGAKIPHGAQTIWWRYKRDTLPCGTLRHRLRNQDPACDMNGCSTEVANKNQYVFQYKAKYDSARDPAKAHHQSQLARQ